MARENYENMSVSQLKELAKGRGIKGVSAMRKAEVINALVEMDSAQTQKEEPAKAGEEKKPAKKKAAEKKPAEKKPAKKKAAEEKPAEEKPAEEKPAAGPSGKEQPQTAQPEKSQGAQRKKISAEPRGQQGRRQENGARTGARQDGHARTIVRRAPAAGADQNTQAQQPRQNAQSQQARQNVQAQQPRQSSQVPQIRPGAQVPQGQNVQAQQGRQAAAAPMTRGELRQSSPQPKINDRAEMIQDRAEGDRPPMELKQLDSGNTVSGVLEVMADGYGFIRSNNYLPGEDDIYVSPSQIRRFNLKTGDIICGNTRVHAQQEKFSALLFVKTINGYLPSEAAKRYNFDEMTPIFPDQRLRMERTGREIAMRIVDILSPIGKGQRGLIVSPPKAGKTTLLKDIARSIQRNNPEMHIIIMLIDERPEEVTDIREAIVGENVEVLDSTFDETPEHHKRVAEMGIERARRLVEHKRDVVILLDSITRLARAYNLIVPPSGRTLSGGLDPAALHPPKRFFGAARNMREGGSLTILATALVDTGSKMDDVVYEEFKGTGNMELILDRKLSERRVFPAIDIMKSGTRREDLLLTTDEGEASYVMRRAMNGMKGEDAVERILDMFTRTRSNEELVHRIKQSHVI